MSYSPEWERQRRNEEALRRFEEKYLTPPDDVPESCEDGECGECARCIEEARRDREEARAEAIYEERMLERYGRLP